MRCFVILSPIVLAVLLGGPDGPPRKSRKFELTYRASVTAVEGKTIDVWLPYPPTDDHQKVELLSLDSPWAGELVRESVHGNRIYHFRKVDPGPGPHEFVMKFLVERKENIRKEFDGKGDAPLDPERKEEMAPYLRANRLVPISGPLVEGISAGIAADEANLVKLARAIYDYVVEKMEYSKRGVGWGLGSTEWACKAGYGNCTDFHSLFISLARARGIPARFSIGLPLPPERGEGKIGGYHCWAEFYIPGYDWVPTDISEADKHPELLEYYFGATSENRVEFTRGRDLVLEPPQKGEPLNYFIYPYVEVDGAPHGAVEREFRYRDLP